MLPFANLSPDPENAYFADGLMEEVIADLSRVGALTVISRTSSVKLRETGWDLRRIGRELNVRYALEGSVRRAGAALRITAQLIDTETDAHLWGEKYSGTVEDVFDLQERLSRRIVEALEITLSPPEDREIAERPIADVRAFEYYQRARQEYYRYSSEGMAAARALAEHGLAVVGPNEALYGMLGTVYAWSPTVLLGVDEETTLREAETCARRAFELNPGSAQGLSIMGQIAYRRGQPGEAVRLLAQACAADPNNPDAMHQLGGAYLLGGRTGPMREVLTRLVELDPLTPSNHCLLGLSWSLGGDAPSAVPSHMRAIELDPRSTICRVCAGVALVAAGREAEAAGQFEWLERQPQDDSLAALARRFRRGLAGRPGGRASPPGAAERAMAESDEYWAYLMAGAYALVGEDRPGAGLARACGHGPGLDRLRVLHAARPVSGEPAAEPAVPGADGVGAGAVRAVHGRRDADCRGRRKAVRRAGGRAVRRSDGRFPRFTRSLASPSGELREGATPACRKIVK